MPQLRIINWKGSPSNGCEVLPCSSESIVNCDANFVKLFLLPVMLEQRLLSISKFCVFMLNGIPRLGGRLLTISPLISSVATLRQGYNIPRGHLLPSLSSLREGSRSGL